MEIIIFFAVVLLIAICGGYLIHHEYKTYRANLFCQKDDTDKIVVFQRFVTRLDAEFNTEVYIEFLRRDNNTIYVMNHDEFKEKFLKL